MMTPGVPFCEIWAVDFEFRAAPGHNPEPLCMVAKELLSGHTIRLWQDELRAAAKPPYDISSESLLVAYYASAEMGCHLALGWDIPTNIVDLYVEFRNFTNGLPTPCGAGLLGALSYFGLGGIQALEKEGMRELAMRGGPFTTDEQTALVAYCETDVEALDRLFPKMLPHIDWPRALLRGRYMAAVAHIERNGVPIDTTTLTRLRENWGGIQDRLIAAIDQDYGVYEGRTFKLERFQRYLATNKIPWPRLPSGQLDMKDDTFREMARTYPCLMSLRELRTSLSQMRLNDLAVGQDRRNRVLLSAFSSRTGRNQPSNTRFIFGPAVWLRGLIKPEPRNALAYIDWSQQEFRIAAALSGDEFMKAAYRSGDPYLEFAKQAGAVPAHATKKSHPEERERFKACVLAVQYGMGAEALAERIGQSPAHARELLRLHRETYACFWRWSDAALDHAMLTGKLWTVFGWTVRPGMDPNPRSLRNFPMQANGAEMLRLACILGVEAGVKICAPVHDAILIKAQSEAIEEQVRIMQGLMAKASAIVLGGFELRSDVKIIFSTERYVDPRGKVMWEKVEELLPAKTAKQAVPPALNPISTTRQIPEIFKRQYKQPAAQGRDGTPPSSEGVPLWDTPVPSHPTRDVLLYMYTLYNNIYIIYICLLE